MSNRELAFTAERLLHILSSFPTAKTYVVGFSGGADSTALLHALNIVREQLAAPISAVHINHGLNDDANLWQQGCESFCEKNGIKLVVLKIEMKHDTGKGMEAEARHLRYQAMTGLMNPGTCLLTGHHADDQAETLLLNLMRGSGVDGLSAMPESRPLGLGLLQRPLLGFKNSALKNYLLKHNIEWTEDPSNQYLNHDRNFVRHEIIPLLEKRWPAVDKRLLLTCKAMTGARHLLDRLADEYLDHNLLHPFVLRLTEQSNCDQDLFKLVIRRWLQQIGIATIPAYRFETFLQQIQDADNTNNVLVAWGDSLLRFYKGRLWLHVENSIEVCPTVNWPEGQVELDLGQDIGQLIFERQDDGNNHPVLKSVAKPSGELWVGARKHADAVSINLGGQHKHLKNIFQSAAIPPWLRECVPLCILNGELVAIGDWCFSTEMAAWMTENQLSLRWNPRHPLLQFIRTQLKVDPAGAVG